MVMCMMPLTLTDAGLPGFFSLKGVIKLVSMLVTNAR